MLIVLEGCDGTGKTTLAELLAEMMTASILHSTSATPNNYEYFNYIINQSVYHNIIADRFMYGQYVYQSPEDRHLSPLEFYALESQLIDTRAKMILVEASSKDISDRLYKRSEKIMNDLSIENVLKAFRGQAAESRLNWTVYNTSTLKSGALVKRG